jgi:DNA-binding HxlR family transcriptional regulator
MQALLLVESKLCVWQRFCMIAKDRHPTPKRPAESRRSVCPVACSLDLFGDRWTMLIIRDLFLGRTRFKEFAASPEKIPTNVLSDRLERLVQQGIIKQIPAADGTKRLAYQMTKRGRTLRPVLEAIRDWGLRWEKGTRVLLKP